MKTRAMMDALQRRGWIVESIAATPEPVPPEVLQRRPWLSMEAQALMGAAKSIASGDQTMWFVTTHELRGQNGTAFAWNDWELQSLEAGRGDDVLLEEIRLFWDSHMPLVMSVWAGYAYFGLSKDGNVVCGREPEYESVLQVSKTLDEFAEMIVAGNEVFEKWL